MPSAAKRRKNAKKKKEKKASSSSTTSSVGNEDLKHGSDGEHNGEQHFTEWEEEEVTEKREDVISLEESKSVDVENHSEKTDKLADKGVVQIETESRLDDDFDNKRRGSSSSNSSSSDDESHSIEKDILVVGNAPDDVEAIDSLTEVPIQISHTTPVSNIDDSVVEAVGDAGVEKVSSLHQTLPEGSDRIDLEPKENGQRKLCTPEESVRHEQVVKVVDPEPKDEVTNAAQASGAIHDGEDKWMHAYKESEGSSASVDNNSLISQTVESELNESGEKELSSVEESTRLTEVLKDMAPEQKNDKEPNDESATHDDEGKLMYAYNEPEGSSASVDNNSLISETVESELKGTVEKELSSAEESARLTEVVKDMALEQKNDKEPDDESAIHDGEVKLLHAYNEPEGSSASVDNNCLISETVESELKESGEKESSSVEKSARLPEVVKDMAPEHKNDKVHNDESATHDGEDKLMHACNEPEGSSASVDNVSLISETVESELKGTDEKELRSVEESARLKEVVKDRAPQQKNDKMPNDAATSGEKESAAHDTEVPSAQAYNAPRDDVAKDMEHVNDSEVIGSSREQAIGLMPVQTTSWKSCCGLFELFAGSNR